jgi:mannose-6-phosphate isomerase-like protein (cupin superfamily)
MGRQSFRPSLSMEAWVSMIDGAGFSARRLATDLDVIAPDGSEIRLLSAGDQGSMCHCTLPPGTVSQAVAHQTVEELWYFVRGKGQVWRSLGAREEILDVEEGWSLCIPTGARFQFKNTGDEPLEFVLVTMPPWPGAQAATAVPGYW